MTRVHRTVLALVAGAVVAAACSRNDLTVPAANPTSAPTAAPAPATTTTTSVPVTTTTIDPYRDHAYRVRPNTPAATATTVAAAPPAGPVTPPAAPPPPPLAPVWPPYEPLPGVTGMAALTNLAVDDTTAVSPVLAVKFDNHPRARPQWELDAADVVFEVNVENLTRFIALFHSRNPEWSGPVRSVRTSDLNVLAALNRPILAWSGGNPYVNDSVRNAHAAGVLVDAGPTRAGRCYRRHSSRQAPHNLVADTSCLRQAGAAAGPARPLWTFGPVPAGVTPAQTPTFQVRMDGVRVEWWWAPEAGRWFRTQDNGEHVAANGVRVSATNVVVMTVDHVPSPADHRSPEAQTVGSGPVVVYRDGISIPGTWHRAEPTAPFTFLYPDGTVIPLADGTTFVQLARPGT